MSKLPAHLEKVRDELSERHVVENRGYDFDVGGEYLAEQMKVDFSIGFKAGVQARDEDMKGLVEALKQDMAYVQSCIDTKKQCSEEQVFECSKEALEKFRGEE